MPSVAGLGPKRRRPWRPALALTGVMGVAGVVAVVGGWGRPGAEDPRADISVMLDAWHDAAADANEAAYFAHFSDDAIFLGTDDRERWTRDEFRAWARPHFEKGKAWSFRARSRQVILGPGRDVAWFDELLDTQNLGLCRGSGVVVRVDGAWKVAHYDLNIPVPNEIVDFVVDAIRTERDARAALERQGDLPPPEPSPEPSPEPTREPRSP